MPRTYKEQYFTDAKEITEIKEIFLVAMSKSGKNFGTLNIIQALVALTQTFMDILRREDWYED